MFSISCWNRLSIFTAIFLFFIYQHNAANSQFNENSYDYDESSQVTNNKKVSHVRSQEETVEYLKQVLKKIQDPIRTLKHRLADLETNHQHFLEYNDVDSNNIYDYSPTYDYHDGGQKGADSISNRRSDYHDREQKEDDQFLQRRIHSLKRLTRKPTLTERQNGLLGDLLSTVGDSADVIMSASMVVLGVTAGSNLIGNFQQSEDITAQRREIDELRSRLQVLEGTPSKETDYEIRLKRLEKLTKNTGSSLALICEALDGYKLNTASGTGGTRQYHCCINKKYNKIFCGIDNAAFATHGVSTANGVFHCDNHERKTLVESDFCGIDPDITPIP